MRDAAAIGIWPTPLGVACLVDREAELGPLIFPDAADGITFEVVGVLAAVVLAVTAGDDDDDDDFDGEDEGITEGAVFGVSLVVTGGDS